MIKYPLFGQDSIPQRTSSIIALAVTVLFWLIFSLVVVVVKPKEKKPKYQTVQIVLAAETLSQNKAEKTEQSAQAAASAVTEQKSVEKPAAPAPAPKVEKSSETAKNSVAKTQPKPASKPQPKKTESSAKSSQSKPAVNPAPKVKEPEVYARDMTDESNFFDKPVKKASNTDKNSDPFADDDDLDFPVTASSTGGVVTKTSGTSGSSGNVEAQNQKITSNASVAQTQNSVSENTTKSLSGVENAEKVNSNSSKSTASSSSSDGSLTFAPGQERKLIMPTKAEITIAEEDQNKIIGKEIKITFIITADGAVVLSDVSANPSQNPVIMEQIKNQLSEWWFSPGPVANATFNWKIKTE